MKLFNKILKSIGILFNDNKRIALRLEEAISFENQKKLKKLVIHMLWQLVLVKKVTAFVGSARKKNTYNSVKKFLNILESFGGIETEIVLLCDYKIQYCKGCKLCLDKGEEFCPLKDDRDKLLEKIACSDGVIFASPNYSFQVSGIMKCFLDRIGFNFHRPRYFGKIFTNIVFQGIYGGDKIVKYLDFVGDGLGFNIIKGICLTAFEPMSEYERSRIDKSIEKLSHLFYEKFNQPTYPVPSILKLMIFRMSRTSIKMALNDNYRDYTYYKEKGWFESDYYYDTSLNIFKKMIGKLFELMAKYDEKKRASRRHKTTG
jgi:multimeric flavodoxin WrbA